MTSSVMWHAYPDLGASTYGEFRSSAPIYELAGSYGYPAIRIDRVAPPLPADLDEWLVFRLSREDGFGDVVPLSDVELS